MAKTKAVAKEPAKTRRVQLWDILEGPHTGKAVYYFDLQAPQIQVQNAVMLFPYDESTRRPINKPFLIRVGTRAEIKKTYYE